MPFKFKPSDACLFVANDNTGWCQKHDKLTEVKDFGQVLDQDSLAKDEITRLFLLFHPSQFQLINRVYKLLERGYLQKVYVSNIGSVGKPTKRSKKFFHSGNAFHLSSSLGGWRPLTSVDIASLRVSATDSDSRSFLACVRKHPVYRHAKFITNLNEQALGEVIQKIVDPRHLLSLFYPHAGSIHGVFKHLSLVDWADEAEMKKSSELLSRCWNSGKYNPEDPGSFLMHNMHMGVEPVVVNRLFVTFLIMGWIDAVSVTHKGRLFVPGYFFNTRTAEAYAKTV